MWYIVLSILIVCAVAVWIQKSEHELFLSFVAAAIAAMILLFVGFFVIPITGGLLPGYSEGEREGYITKLSVKGIVFKTNEGQLQVGTGDMAALQEPWDFSVVDPIVLRDVKQCLGRKSRVEYTEWLIQPFKRGSSGYEVVRVSCQ